MSSHRTPAEIGCEEARRVVHDRLDGATGDTALGREVDVHLMDCAECQAHAVETRTVVEALRALPVLAMPDDALQEVFAGTVEEEARARSRARLLRIARWAAVAAAVLVVAAVSGWLALPSREGSRMIALSPEVARAAADVRLVLEITDRVVRRTEQAALQEVEDRLVPAIRTIPVFRSLYPKLPERRS